MVRPLSDKKVWQILNTTVLLAFILMFAMNVAYFLFNRETPLSALLVFEIILLILTFAGLTLSYFTEDKFMIYAVLCLFWGFDGLLSGKGLIGFIIYAVSFLFLWRQHRISPKAYLTVFIGSLPIPVTIILLSYEGESLSKTLMQIVAFTILCALSYFLIHPAIAKKRITVRETIDISELGLSKREIRILESALNAEKYTAIATSERISVSYVKKCMKNICLKMQVADRTELLATYGGYAIGDADAEGSRRIALN